MNDLQSADLQPSRRIAAIAPRDIPAFIRQQIARKEMLPLIRDLNREMLSGDKSRKIRAEEALRRLGFL